MSAPESGKPRPRWQYAGVTVEAASKKEAQQMLRDRLGLTKLPAGNRVRKAKGGRA